MLGVTGSVATLASLVPQKSVGVKRRICTPTMEAAFPTSARSGNVHYSVSLTGLGGVVGPFPGLEERRCSYNPYSAHSLLASFNIISAPAVWSERFYHLQLAGGVVGPIFFHHQGRIWRQSCLHDV